MGKKMKFACKIIGYLDLWAHCVLFVATVVFLVLVTLVLNTDEKALDLNFWTAAFNKADSSLNNGNSTNLESTPLTTDSTYVCYFALVLLCILELMYARAANQLLTAFITDLPRRHVRKRVEIWICMKVIAVLYLLVAAVTLSGRYLEEWAMVAMLCVAVNFFVVVMILSHFSQIFYEDVEKANDAKGDDVSSEEDEDASKFSDERGV